MTQIVHDESGELDWILDYEQRTRLGNYMVKAVRSTIADVDAAAKLLVAYLSDKAGELNGN